ncbi:unnamed protein product [Peniophora sp. CBMAI 1063]|nr:unnamed protein product [Peniophora sp. CBMAI 1063]
MSSAIQAKERQYAQLASSLTRLSRAIGQTSVLFEQLQVDLDAMRTLSGLHAAQFMTGVSLSAGMRDWSLGSRTSCGDQIAEDEAQ